jgi:hypothetical protein
LKKSIHQIYSDISKDISKIYQPNAIGIMLIAVGIILLNLYYLGPIKMIFFTISISLILIGLFIIFMKTGDARTNYTLNYTNSFPILLIILIIIVFTITTITNIIGDYYIVSSIFFQMIIGLLVINEIISESLPLILRNRLHFSIFVFFSIFLILITIEILKIVKT